MAVEKDPRDYANRATVFLHPSYPGKNSVLVNFVDAEGWIVFDEMFDTIEEAAPMIEVWNRNPPEKNLELANMRIKEPRCWRL